ncbi:hypothetical protein T190_00480 [Sinorhizobium meliloti CCBAU 01290]|nr:hypothetical protein T190_00480 [Sinorhizobium meliloti CCBAU 01290]
MDAAMLAMITATRSAELRIFLADQLRLAGVAAPDIMALRIAGRPDLDQHLLRWLAASDAPAASKLCLELILAGSADIPLIETLAFVQIDETQRVALTEFADRQNLVVRTTLGVLIGTPEFAVSLLTSPDARVRALAAGYVTARDDRDAILKEAAGASSYADFTLIVARQLKERLVGLLVGLEALPKWHALGELTGSRNWNSTITVYRWRSKRRRRSSEYYDGVRSLHSGLKSRGFNIKFCKPEWPLGARGPEIDGFA